MKSTYTLEITEICNFRCLFCFVSIKSPQEGGRMSAPGTVVKQLEEIKAGGHDSVCFTGGEPTLHPDLPEFVRVANRIGLVAVINTQGLRFSETAYLDAFRGADFSCLLSFHSHKEEIYNRITRTNAYEPVVAGIKNLLERGIPVALSHVLNAHNYSDFPAWVVFVRDRFARYNTDSRILLTAALFFNQEEDKDESMVAFEKVRPYITEGLKSPGFSIEYNTPCTVSHCMFIDGFQQDAANFSKETRERNLEMLKTAPYPLQRQMMKYFVPEKCYSCRLYLRPTCKGIRKNYLMAFGHGEFDGLLSDPEKAYVDLIRDSELGKGERTPLRSSPYIIFGKSGAHAKEAIPELTKTLLGSFDHRLRCEAAVVLGGMVCQVPEVVAILLRAMADPDTETRERVVDALFSLDPPPPVAVQGILERMKEPGMPGRRFGARILSKMKCVPDEAAGALIDLLRSPDAHTRRYAVLALTRIETPTEEIRSAIKSRLEDADSVVRSYAAMGFASHRAPKEAGEILINALSDPDGDVRREAAYALSLMTPPLEEATERLLVLLQDPQPRTRANAALALSKVAARSPAASAGLAAALEDEDGDVRREASAAFMHIGFVPPEAVPAMARLLEDPNIAVRRIAAYTFSKMDAPPKEALAALEKAREDADPEIRREAQYALSKV